MYIPLWEDSKWYTIKPMSDLAEDCQVWCGGDEKIEEKSRYMLHVHVTCYMLYVLYIANIYIPLWEDSQWYAIKNLRQIWQRIARFRHWGDEKLEEHVTESALYNFDMYVPLWEDSQWYIMKPASDLAEDCQIWRWGDGNGGIILLIVTCYMFYILLIYTYHCERIHSGMPSKPTSDLAEDCQVSTLGRWKIGGICYW